MAGYTNLPFRLLSREYGADITVSEMISAKGLYYLDKKTEKLMATTDVETPFGIQLFGSDPEILSDVAGKLRIRNNDPEDPVRFDFIDFNAGCPAPKIVKNGDGSALLTRPLLLGQCIESLVEASDVPVTVKIRKGFNKGENFSKTLAELSERAGASALAVHGRTREEYYQGHSDWNAVAEAAAAVDIPVILSGDIHNLQDAERALKTGVKSLMIGRAAVGDPVLFRRIKNGLKKEQENCSDDNVQERIRAALRHIELTEQYDNSKYAIIEMRKHLAAYTKGLPDSSSLRNKIFHVTTPEDACNLFADFL